MTGALGLVTDQVARERRYDALRRGVLHLEVGPDVVVLTLPIATVSEPNVRGHWSARAKRARGQRSLVAMALMPRVRGFELPVSVLITRLSPGRLDDDNLRGAMKAVRDGVTDALGLKDDSDPRLAWLYAQERTGWTGRGRQRRALQGVQITVVKVSS